MNIYIDKLKINKFLRLYIFLLNREETHNALFKDALNKVKTQVQIKTLVLQKILSYTFIY